MKKAFALGFNKALLVAVLTSAMIACLPAHVLAQSLDAAVTEQLRTIAGIACDTLRGTDPLTSLQGGAPDDLRPGHESKRNAGGDFYGRRGGHTDDASRRCDQAHGGSTG